MAGGQGFRARGNESAGESGEFINRNFCVDEGESAGILHYEKGLVYPPNFIPSST